MGINRMSGIRKPLATQDDILQAGKAIHDKMLMEMDDKFQVTESEIGMRLGKVLDTRLDKAISIEFNKRLNEIESKYQDKINILQRMVEQTLGQMRDFIQAIQIPAPVISVNIPDQQTPVVNVSLPEMSITLPEMSVQLPQTLAPEVIVNIPEYKMQDIVVNIPEKKKTTKHIAYDEYSRPVIISEE